MGEQARRTRQIVRFRFWWHNVWLAIAGWFLTVVVQDRPLSSALSMVMLVVLAVGTWVRHRLGTQSISEAGLARAVRNHPAAQQVQRRLALLVYQGPFILLMVGMLPVVYYGVGRWTVTLILGGTLAWCFFVNALTYWFWDRELRQISS